MSGRQQRGHPMVARQIMEARVLTVDPEMTADEVLQLFLERQITGAPVVDEDGKLLGVISQTDLLRHQGGVDAHPAPPQPPSYYLEADGELLVRHLQVEGRAATRVRDLMTPAAYTTEHATPLQAIARFMWRKRIHRVLVTRRGTLVGVITTMDLLRALAWPRARSRAVIGSASRRRSRRVASRHPKAPAAP